MEPFDLDDALLARQVQLRGSLMLGQIALDHPGARGDDSELHWRALFREFLPNRYSVSKGQVTDASGARSDELDVIVHDAQYTPILFQNPIDASSVVIPAESVYAAFEVKQNLDKAHLEYGSNKIASVRRLDRTSIAITHAGGTFQPRDPFPILGGFLGSRCDWKPCFGHPFRTTMGSLTSEGFVDLGCVLDSGSFEATSTGSEVLLEISDPESALVFFLVRLFSRLQALGTAPAIDIRAYTKAIWEQGS